MGGSTPGRCPVLACVAPLALSGHARPRRFGAVALNRCRISMIHPSAGTRIRRRGGRFSNASASLRLGGRFSFSRFTQGQRGPSKHVTEGIPLRGRFPPWAVHPPALVRDVQALNGTPSGSPPGSVGGRFPALRTAGPPSGAAGEGTRALPVEAGLEWVRGKASGVEGGTLRA